MVVKLAEEVLPHVSKITIIIAGTAEACTLAMISDKKEKGGVPVLPINIKGTAAEVEAELANAIKLVFADNKEVFSNAVEAAEAVKVAATKPASQKTASKAKTSKEKEDEDDADDEKEEVEEKKPSKLTPTQIKVQKDQKKNFDRAEKASDPDVVNFVENEIMKAYKAALMPEDVFVDLKVKFDAIRDKLGKPKEEAAGTGMFAGAAEQSKQPSVAPTTEHTVAEKKAEPVVEKKAEPVVEKKAAPAPPSPAPEEEIIF